MKAFLCHCSTDWKFVAQVAVHLKRNLDEVFCFEEQTRLQPSIPSAIGQALQTCDVLIVFVGAHFSEWQEREASSVLMQSVKTLI